MYVVFNTFFGLLTQDEQVSCFEAVAGHLVPGGTFVMQAFVPDVTRYDVHNQRVAAESVGVDEVRSGDLVPRSLHPANRQRLRGYPRRRVSHVPGSYPVRVRLGVGPHGVAGWTPAARALVGMGS